MPVCLDEEEESSLGLKVEHWYSFHLLAQSWAVRPQASFLSFPFSELYEQLSPAHLRSTIPPNFFKHHILLIETVQKNIARGTTDPGYRVYNLSYLSSWIECHLYWSKFGQMYVVPLVLVQNLTTRWCHQNWFQIWPTCNAISIGSNFDPQVALLAF